MDYYLKKSWYNSIQSSRDHGSQLQMVQTRELHYFAFGGSEASSSFAICMVKRTNCNRREFYPVHYPRGQIVNRYDYLE